MVTLSAIPNNLPLQLSSFIGRELEIAEVQRLLASARLVTLTGVGGVGKTRLALAVATLQFDCQDGVWFVDLSPLADPALVPQVVATTLGLTEQAGRRSLDTLTDHLRTHEALLLLDNCEHLVSACARLTEHVLQACPRLRILVTSREALGIGGETVWPVPPLHTPDLTQAAVLTPEQLLRFESARLFVERARATQPGFALTAANAPAVVQICHRLDGIPLALELAAARIKLLPAEQIAARLDDRFRLLTGGSRTALPRRQTLRALVDWSYDLLSEPERVLLRRLSVFAGGWTLDAAESVTTLDSRPDPVDKGSSQFPLLFLRREDVLDLLARLVDKSLLVADARAVSARYRMLETIRQYAWERLAEAGEGMPVRSQHLGYYFDLAKQAEAHLTSAARKPWLERLEAEHDNLRAALEWASEHDAVQAMQLAAALRWFWYFNGHSLQGRDWLERVLARPGEPSAVKSTRYTSARAKALMAAGFMIAYGGGEPKAAHAHLLESITLWRVLGDNRYLAEVLLYHGWAMLRQSNQSQMIPTLEESVALARETAETWLLAFALGTLGLALSYSPSSMDRARTLVDESIALWQQIAEPWGLGQSQTYRAGLALRMGQLAEARAFFMDALAERRLAGDRWTLAISLNDVGDLLRFEGDYAQARALQEEALALFTAVGDQASVTKTKRKLGLLALSEGDYEEARAQLARSLAEHQAAGNQAGMALCLSAYGALAASQGQAERAVRLCAAATGLMESLHYRMVATDHIEHERNIAAGRERLPEADFARAWAVGQQLTLEQALAEAAAVTVPPGPAAAQQAIAPEWGGLSERERAVARLVAQGLSNREIAEALVLSRRTVETHVANIFNKLGFSSRAQVRQWVRDKPQA